MSRHPKPRLLFYFLHLLGVGHVYRAKRLIEGFARHGIDVDVIYGGDPISETFEAASVHYLPPIRAEDASYQTYLDENGLPLSSTYLEKRQQNLLAHFATLNPDMILFEAFPFGRRMVRHEIQALLEVASQRPSKPLIVSSVRDILQEHRKPGRVEETRDLVRDRFDHELVHSDPRIISLDATFPLTAEIADKLTYTGFVIPQAKSTKSIEKFDVIGSVGGGGFGAQLLETVVGIAKSGPLEGASWCLATGPNMAPETVDQLKQRAPENVTIVKRLDNLAAHLTKAKLSISQCGYNTAMDVLSAHRDSDCRAVFVPYDTQGQSEQLRRAELLEKAGYAINLPQSKLDADRLKEAIQHALALPKVEHEIDFNGVENTAIIVRKWLDQRVST